MANTINISVSGNLLCICMTIYLMAMPSSISLRGGILFPWKSLPEQAKLIPNGGDISRLNECVG
jgi:hypothetical protein